MQQRMMPVKRWILRQFTRRTRPYLKSYGLLRTVKYKNALVGSPGAGSVLVLAPHMDDEVIGCGGAIIKHIRNGASVTVVFLTDGRYGSRELLKLSGEARLQREREVMMARRHESERALDVLGVSQAVYWDAEETTLSSDATLPRKLTELITTVKPDIVYLPCFLEEHADHRAVNEILLRTMAQGMPDFDCLGYEVWTTLFPNYLVDIGDVVQVKKQALAEYESQLSDSNYIHTALGLNAYRSSSLLDSGGYAEAYFAAPVGEYLAAYRSFCGMLKQ